MTIRDSLKHMDFKGKWVKGVGFANDMKLGYVISSREHRNDGKYDDEFPNYSHPNSVLNILHVFRGKRMSISRFFSYPILYHANCTESIDATLLEKTTDRPTVMDIIHFAIKLIIVYPCLSIYHIQFSSRYYFKYQFKYTKVAKALNLYPKAKY